MNIALVFPKSTFLQSPMTWPPLGLFYLATQIEAQGHITEFFDLSEDELPQDGQFDQLWLSATSPQMYEVRKIGEIVKDWTDTTTVFGGAAPWANPSGAGELPFDMIVSGEADHPDTVRYILENAPSGFQQKYAPPISPNLDWVLPPVRRWTTRYHATMKGHRMASLFTTRGCCMSCAFCESGRNGVIWDSQVRYEPLSIVEQQISECKAMGFTGLGFYDDILPLNRRRMAELLKIIRNYGMVFRCFLRSDIINKQGGKEYLAQMAEAGLIEIFLGIESADDQIKRNIHKGTTIEQDANIVRWCKELGITCKASFILGLPGETLETMERTRAWILEHRPDIVQCDRLIPFPGTPLTTHPEEYDLQYERTPDEQWFFRGRHDLSSKSFVSTSALTSEQIDRFWHDLEAELLREGLSGLNH